VSPRNGSGLPTHPSQSGGQLPHPPPIPRIGVKRPTRRQNPFRTFYFFFSSTLRQCNQRVASKPSDGTNESPGGEEILIHSPDHGVWLLCGVWPLSRGVSIRFFGKWKTNKMRKTSVLISNLCSILCFSRWCVLCGKLGLDLFNTSKRSTGAIIHNYFQHYCEIIRIVVI
jgi:hypothetical protein